MRIVIAPDKFKGSLSAAEVARHIAEGLRTGAPEALIDEVPLADGGEGTLDAAVAAGFERHTLTVSGPDGLPVQAHFGVRGPEALIEAAQASGLGALSRGRLDPLGATSLGTGQLIRAALDLGCDRIILGAGGSACTDGGAGILVALGAQFLDAKGTPVPHGGAGLREIVEVDLDGLDERLRSTEFILASDVVNPLLGPTGAATVFAPQKGAAESEVSLLEQSLGRYVQALSGELGQRALLAAEAPGAGAAGGIGYALIAVMQARQTPGISLVHGLTRFVQRLRGASLLVTGEGRLDRQSLGGKVPVGSASAAMGIGIPAVAVCGTASLSRAEIVQAGFHHVYALTDLEPDPATCMQDAPRLLQEVGRAIAGTLRAGSPSPEGALPRPQ